MLVGLYNDVNVFLEQHGSLKKCSESSCRDTVRFKHGDGGDTVPTIKPKPEYRAHSSVRYVTFRDMC